MQLQMKKEELKLDEKCIFCKIIKGDIPCAKIFENGKVFAFLDIAPANKGHALIVTKNHYETLLDIPDEELNDLMLGAKKIARAMSSALASEGYNLLMNNRKVAGQLVFHAHLHIIPRFTNDRISLNWDHKKYKDKEIDEFKEKIKSFL